MNPAVRLPADVADAVQGRWGARGSEWAQAVEPELVALCARHGATPVRVLPARYSYVVLADTSLGDRILRSTPDPEAWDQARVVRMLAECHAGPEVWEVIVTETGVWTLMERVFPGISLLDAMPGSVTMDDLARPFRVIFRSHVDVAGLPRVADWLRTRLALDALSDIPTGQTVAPMPERTRALALLDDLEAGRQADMLCHGDAHPGNVLVSTGASRILLIDPRGRCGEAAYDVGVLALKAARYDHGAARRLASQVADLAGVDAARAAAWVEVAHAARV